MLLQAASDFGISLADSVLIGDRISDIEAAAAADIRFRILLGDREANAAEHAPSHTAVPDLAAALALLRNVAIDRTRAR